MIDLSKETIQTLAFEQIKRITVKSNPLLEALSIA